MRILFFCCFRNSSFLSFPCRTNTPKKKGKVVGDHTRVVPTGSAKPPKSQGLKRKRNEVVKTTVRKEVETTAGDCSTVVVDTSPPPAPQKRKRTSKAWDEFEEIFVNGVVVSGKCKHCPSILGAKSENGTSSLTKHLKSCFAYQRTQKKVDQMFLKASELEDGDVAAYNFKFIPEVTRDLIARMIILHELPFYMVEYVLFGMVLSSLQPNFKLVKRTTAKTDCMKVYNYEKKLLYETFSKVQSRISLTTDMWTCNSQNKGYMALTTHYIDEEWRVQKRILSFSLVDGQHTGANIAKVLMDKLLEWNIDRKIGSITLDNASTNEVVVDELVNQLKPGNGLLLDGELFQVRCSAHLIAIIVDFGMKEIKEEIQKVRNSVKFIRDSPQRQRKFEEVCLQVNAPKKKLVQDVDTRWNSTYTMLETALSFREAFERYGKFEPDFLKVAPGEEDWNNASSLSICLKVFYDITVLFSGTKYLTVNRYFDVACCLYIEIHEWCNSEDKLISKMTWNMMERFEKYWEITSPTFAIASILDPRFKMKSVSFYFPQLYADNSEREELKVKELLKRLYNEYATRYASSAHVYSGGIPTNDVNIHRPVSTSSSGTLSCQSSFTSKRNSFTTYLEESSQNAVVLTDLEQYLIDDALPISKGSGVNDDSFDVLGWWKFYERKYPIVALMARDILAIPASSVASESVFSTSGRVVDKFRSSMLPETIEALICGQDWIRSGLESKLSFSNYLC
ncbi:hypothetical protein MKW92_013536 [Papaver armeniacum]|nr:hypothetical protein MKW92_013536 [Papaver armeniacum]